MPSLDLTQPLHIIGSDGVYRLQPAQFLGQVADLGRQLAATASSKVPAAVRLSDGRVLNLQTQGAAAFVAAPLSAVKLRTYFKLDGEAFVPTFTQSPDYLQMDLTWTVPVGMRLWFGLRAQFEGAEWDYQQAHLFAQKTGEGGFFRLPLPNVYEDSRICMGTSFEMSKPSLPELMEGCLAHFDNSSWNTDLLFDPEHAARLIRFHRDTTETLPPAAEWSSLCRHVSHANLEKFV